MTDKGNIAIIGGGAAGLAAAVFAAESGGRPFIVEKNDRVGKKLRITGKGRCDVTNNSDVNTRIANTLTNPRFMCGPLSNFTPADTMAFFKKRSSACRSRERPREGRESSRSRTTRTISSAR